LSRVKSFTWLALTIVTAWTLPATAEVVLRRSNDAVVLENGLVRVELHRKQNFHPVVLVDKRNPRPSLIDDIGFIAWDVARADWLRSTTSDWQVSIESSQDKHAVSCQTTLSQDSPGGIRSFLKLRTTIRDGSPAVDLVFDAKFRTDHIQSVGLQIQGAGFQQAEWTTAWGTRTLGLVGRKNSFHAMLGFQNGLALTRKKDDPPAGMLLFHNTAWNTVFPTLREKPTFVRFMHSTLASPARCNITLVPFVNRPNLVAATKQFGRPDGVKLPVPQPRSKSKRPTSRYTLTPADKQRGLVVFPVPPFETVLPDLLPPAQAIGEAVRIRACAGEYEPASFAIRALKPLRDLTLRFDNLVQGDRIIPANAIDAHVVKVWRQAGPSTMADATLGSGEVVPELLLKDDGVSLAGPRPAVRLDGQVKTTVDANSTKQFWLTVHVPDKLPAGRYLGNVVVTSANTQPLKIPLEVDVLPFSLAASRKKQGIWFKAERRRDQREYVEPDVYRRLLRDVRAHGMQFVTIRGRGLGTAQDVLKIHEAAGMSGTAIWSSWFPSSARDFAPLRASLEKATRKHGYQKLYFQAADEPNSEAQIARALTYFTRVKAAGGRTFCNIMPEYAIRLGDKLDVPCVGYSNFFGSLERPEPAPRESSMALASLLKTHDDVWYYWQCRVEDPRINRLLFGFLLMKSPATGAMPYTYGTLEAEDPFNDWSALQRGQLSRAGGGAVYHVRDGSLPTIQWEAAREGVDDARYVSTLEGLIDQARLDPGLSAAVARANKTLKTVYSRLPDHLYDTMATVSPGVLDEMRSEIINEILRLRRIMSGR